MQNTRRRAVEAATRLFVARGFSATTVNAVADEAGISPETIYASLGGKRGLLESVIENAIHGPDGVEIARQTWLSEVAALPTARARLRGWVGASCRTLARTSPVHAVIRGAADRDGFAVDLRDRLLRERTEGVIELADRFLGDALRTGLTARTAGLRYATLLSPELYHLSVEQLGWTPAALQEWLSAVLEGDLLDPAGGAADAGRAGGSAHDGARAGRADPGTGVTT
jgi:AcrR family transcriptional regulator